MILTKTFHTSTVMAAAWHPQGTTLAISNGDVVNILDVDTGKTLQSFRGDTFGVTSLSWSPDGSMLAAAGNRVVVWDIQTGQNLNILQFPDNETNGGNVEWSPTGERLLFSRWNYDVNEPFGSIVRVWEANTHEVTDIDQRLTSSLHLAHWSPDGYMIAVTNGDELTVWESATGDLLLRREDVNDVAAVAWGPDNMSLAFGNITLMGLDENGTLQFDPTIQIVNVDSGDIMNILKGDIGIIDVMVWHPTENVLAFNGLKNALLLWDLRSGLTIAINHNHTDLLTGLAWSFDGTKLVSASRDGIINIWGYQVE